MARVDREGVFHHRYAVADSQWTGEIIVHREREIVEGMGLSFLSPVPPVFLSGCMKRPDLRVGRVWEVQLPRPLISRGGAKV